MDDKSVHSQAEIQNRTEQNRDGRYSHLKTIDLGGWVLQRVLLEDFLARHASTLSAIHFINCHLVGDQVSLAKWAGEVLNLGWH